MDQAYHLNFSVKTSKIGDALYKIRDTVDVWVDTESLQLIKQVKKLRERNIRRESTTTIQGNKATTNGKEYTIPENIFDPYALIMILKNENILEKESKKFTIHLFTESQFEATELLVKIGVILPIKSLYCPNP